MTALLFLEMVMAVFVWPPQVLHAQTDSHPIHAEWMIGSSPENGWTVGDRIPLSLRAVHPPDLELILPDLPESWGPFEVREQTLADPVENEDGTLTTVREMTVTLWAPGEVQTPPTTIHYRDSTDQLREAPVPPLSIKLVSVLEKGEQEKRDLKPQISLPRPPVWPWLLGGILLAALVSFAALALLTRLRRRETSSARAVFPIDDRPPHEIAYGELDRIAALKLPVTGELKRHYTLVADCLRTYVQGRYYIPALDQTTEELLAAFRQARVDRDHASLFRELLAEADLVKFAKLVPSIDRPSAIIAQARHIIDVTKTVKEGGSSESGAQHTQGPSGPLPGTRGT